MGPGSSILLKSIPSESTSAKILAVLKQVSNRMDQDDFWVVSTKPIGGSVDAEGQPFGLTRSQIDQNNSDAEFGLISHQIGFKPQFELGVYAMCNGKIDHRILGELTYYLARELDGVIDFGGAIYPYASLPKEMKKGMWILEKAEWTDIEPYFEEMVKNMVGKIFTIEYKTTNERNWAYHICDVEFMANWLANPNFYMIK